MGGLFVHVCWVYCDCCVVLCVVNTTDTRSALTQCIACKGSWCGAAIKNVQHMQASGDALPTVLAVDPWVPGAAFAAGGSISAVLTMVVTAVLYEIG